MNELIAWLESLKLISTAGWCGLAILVYYFSLWLYGTTGNNIVLHPILVSAALLLAIIYSINFDVKEVTAQLFPLHWLLGPVTVALAIPIYNQIKLLQRLGLKVIWPIVIGGALAPVTAWCILLLYGSSQALQMTILSKSITTPLAMETAGLIGGIPAIAAIVVILTGIVGVIASRFIFSLTNTHNHAIQGLVLGVCAHGIGTAKALLISEKAGAFASLALGVNGVLTASLLSVLFAQSPS